MLRLTTDALGAYGGRRYVLTLAVEPDPSNIDSFDPYDDAEEWCVTIHHPARLPNDSETEIARIDTTHGRPHFDKLHRREQPKEWLPREFSLADAEQLLVSRWREFAETFEQNHR